jgi:hypothetical protein
LCLAITHVLYCHPHYFNNRAVSKLQELLSGNYKTGINFRARNVLRAAVENQTSFALSFKVSEAGLGFVLKLVIAATKWHIEIDLLKFVKRSQFSSIRGFQSHFVKFKPFK